MVSFCVCGGEESLAIFAEFMCNMNRTDGKTDMRLLTTEFTTAKTLALGVCFFFFFLFFATLALF